MKNIFIDPKNFSDPTTREMATRITRNDPKTGRRILRASKPDAPRKIEVPNPDAKPSDIFKTMWVYETVDGYLTGHAQYVWRQVVFVVSDAPAHQCMPVMDICSLGGSFETTHRVTKVLDEIADEIVNSIPVAEWAGVARWGRALGYLR